MLVPSLGALGATPRFGSVGAPRPATFNPFSSGGAPPPPPPSAPAAPDPFGIKAAVQSMKTYVAPRYKSPLWAAAKKLLKATPKTYGTQPQQGAPPPPQVVPVQQQLTYQPGSASYAAGGANLPTSSGGSYAAGGANLPTSSGGSDAGAPEGSGGLMGWFDSLGTGGKLLVGVGVVGGVFVVYKLVTRRGGSPAPGPKS